MGRVAKKKFPDAVKSSWNEGMFFGSDERARRKKDAPAMLYHLANTPDGKSNLEEITAWLQSQGMDTFRPLAMGAERAVFDAGDRVVKVGPSQTPYRARDYRPPEGVWGVTPWLADTQVGRYGIEVQPRVELIDPSLGGTVRRKPGYADIRALQRALQRQGWHWTDQHPGNVGFVPGKEYKPTVIDGTVKLDPEVVHNEGQARPFPFIPPDGPHVPEKPRVLREEAEADLQRAIEAFQILQRELAAKDQKSFFGTEGSPMLAALLGGGAAGTDTQAESDGAGMAETTDESRSLERPLLAGADPQLIRYLKSMQPGGEKMMGDVPAGFYYEGQSEPLANAFLPRPFQQMIGAELPINAYSDAGDDVGEEYRRRASLALNTPSIRDGDSVISPMDYLIRTTGHVDARAVREWLTDETVKELSSGKEITPATREMLLLLKEQGVGGKKELFPGQTNQEREARRKSDTQETRYMTSANFDKNMLATRAYNVLSAIQDDPELRPDFASPVSAFYGGIAAGLTPSVVNERGDLGADNRHLAYLRNVESTQNPIRARAMEANYWDDLAEKGRAEGQYKDSLFGAYGPQQSWTTSRGAQRSDEDNANLNSLIGSFAIPQFLSGTLDLGSNQARLITELARNIKREVPIIPEGMDRVEAEQTARDLENATGSMLQRYSQERPMYQRSWNNAMDGLAERAGMIGVPLPTESLKFSEFSAPTPLENSVVTAPKYWFDAPTVATLGATLPLSVARAGLKGTAKAVATDFLSDQPVEMGFGVGLHASEQPYSSDLSKMYMEPLKNSFVTDENKQLVDPNSPSYPQYLERHQEERQKLLGGLLDTAQKYYGTRETKGGRDGRGRNIGQR
jgi:hypothetical protein